jgi:hypothetical protein
MILKAVERDYLLEIKDNTLGFLNQMPRSMINHLCSRDRAMDFAGIKTLPAERFFKNILTELKRQ